MGALDGFRGGLGGHPFGQGGLPKGALVRPGGGARPLALTPPRNYRGRATAAIPTAGIILPAAAGGAEPYTYTLTGLPAGLAFDASARQITGTPTTAGTETPSYTVTDDAGTTATQTFDFPVVAETALITHDDWDNRGYGLESRTTFFLALIQSEGDIAFVNTELWRRPPRGTAISTLLDADGNATTDYADMTFTQGVGGEVFVSEIIIRPQQDRVVLYQKDTPGIHFGTYMRGEPFNSPSMYIRVGNDEQVVPFLNGFTSDLSWRRSSPDLDTFLRTIEIGTRVLIGLAPPP